MNNLEVADFFETVKGLEESQEKNKIQYRCAEFISQAKNQRKIGGIIFDPSESNDLEVFLFTELIQSLLKNLEREPVIIQKEVGENNLKLLFTLKCLNLQSARICDENEKKRRKAILNKILGRKRGLNLFS